VRSNRLRRSSLRRVPQGFTLVELMVVIAIIAILTSLLIPAVSMVRGSSRQTECASNLRQIGTAVINATTAGKRLQPGKLISTSQEEREAGMPNRVNLGMPRLLEDHMNKNYSIFKCPSVSGEEVGYATTVHFGFNGRLGRLTSNDAGKVIAMDYGKEIIDWTDDAEWDKYDSEWTGSGIAPLRRHFDGCNVVFFDGHVERMDPDTIRHGKSHDTAYENATEYWAPKLDEKRYVQPVNGTGGDGNSEPGGAWDGPQVPIPNIVGASSSSGGEADTGGQGSKYHPEVDPNDPGRKYTGDTNTYGPSVGQPEPCEFLLVIDNDDPGFSKTSNKLTNKIDDTAMNGSHFRAYANNFTSGEARWSAADLRAGTYKVSASWGTTEKPRFNAVAYLLVSDTETQSTTINQNLDLEWTDDEGRGWTDLGQVAVGEGGTLDVQMPAVTATVGHRVCADAMRFEIIECADSGGGGGGNDAPVEEEPEEPVDEYVAMIDNEDAAFSKTSIFKKKLDATAVNGHQWMAYAKNFTQGEARWSFTDVPEGSYRVSATWGTSDKPRYNAVAYNLVSDNDSQTGTINQNIDFEWTGDDGVGWTDVGQVNVGAGGTLEVVIPPVNFDKYHRIMADVIRIEKQ